LALLILGGQQLVGLVSDWLNMALMPHTEDLLHRAVLGATAAYVALMAVPFVPGAEIGLALLTAIGGSLAPLIYLATAGSLSLAYLVGRLLPPELLARGLAALGLRRASGFVTEAAAMDEAQLRAWVTAQTGPKPLRAALRHRYVALALVVNLPGNVVLGGGGGIALVAGLSRIFEPVPFLLTVLPVPLAFYLGGV
jgi:hypothetical protein